MSIPCPRLLNLQLCAPGPHSVVRPLNQHRYVQLRCLKDEGHDGPHAWPGPPKEKAS